MNLINNKRSSGAFIDRINSVLHHGAFCALELEQLRFAQTPPLPAISLSVKIFIDFLFSVLQG
jgi:hypothetical protein